MFSTVFHKLNIGRLPSDWPSPYHNKCSNRKCHYPNPPQPKEDVYLCGGRLHGGYCEGTFAVTDTKARRVVERRRAEEAKKIKHQEKVRNMRREEARVIWGQDGCRGQRVVLPQEHSVRRQNQPLSIRNGNIKGKGRLLFRRHPVYPKGESFLEL